MRLDSEFVRRRFPALGGGWILMDNAGGTQVLGTVADRIRDYLLHTNVQLGATYAVSQEAEARVRAGRVAAAALMNAAGPENVVLGPSTTALLRRLAEAVAGTLGENDEIIVTNCDHEVNIGPWVRLAATGPRLKVWKVRAETHELELEDLDRLMTERTRLVCFTHVSNIFGTLNPLRDIVRHVHARGARVCVDGVACAPHRRVDVTGWDVDYYVLSFYKLYGPHQAALYVRPGLEEDLANLNHFFLAGAFPARLEPGSVNYELVAGLPAIVEYFEELAAHAGAGAGAAPGEKLAAAFEAIAAHEATLQRRLLAFLATRPRVRVIGRTSADPAARVPTVSFVREGTDSATIPARLDAHRIGIRYGHFYAYRLIDDLGLAAQNGVVRVSLVHYNTLEEVDALIRGLEEVL
ncbi:MAG: cysteine desulfurase-like protein [Planctomycetes bacterium]|nr:cysteine desulfurase-like protein [Planctomycetota bacterium]